MEIVKVKYNELKELELTPVWKERGVAPIPFIVINENNEVLLGNNSINANTDENGMVECVKLPISDNMKSRQVCFLLHYIGLTTTIGYKNFNSMDCPHPSLNGLYLWDRVQFELTTAEAKKSTYDEDYSLF